MAAGLAHPDAMAPSKPGPTRTAPPLRAPTNSRMRVYTLFGLTGFVYLAVSISALEIVWALGGGAESWAAMQGWLASPIAIAFHALSFASVIFVAVRFFSLFPKAQPARIGPIKPPPGPLLHAGLYAAWIGLTLVLSAILAGGLF